MAFIEVKNLKKIYKVGDEKVRALDGINLAIDEGEVCCILGTSGSGKSTLLNMLAGLEPPSKGTIHMGKARIEKMNESALTDFRRKNVGFVFQSYNLMPGLSAWQNVALPLEFRGVAKKDREEAAKEMLCKVGLSERLEHTPNEMSGGQQQRVGIARAFVHRPKLVFADEPTGNLDTKSTIDVMILMVTMARKYKQTLIIVTHDPEIADYADRIIHLIDGKIDSDKKVTHQPSSLVLHDNPTDEEAPFLQKTSEKEVKKKESSEAPEKNGVKKKKPSGNPRKKEIKTKKTLFDVLKKSKNKNKKTKEM